MDKRVDIQIHNLIARNEVRRQRILEHIRRHYPGLIRDIKKPGPRDNPSTGPEP